MTSDKRIGLGYIERGLHCTHCIAIVSLATRPDIVVTWLLYRQVISCVCQSISPMARTKMLPGMCSMTIEMCFC